MTGMLAAQRDGVVARRLNSLPVASMPEQMAPERMAAVIGRQDAARPGARLRRFLGTRPVLLKWVRLVFGLGIENGLADERLEAIRNRAFVAALDKDRRPLAG